MGSTEHYNLITTPASTAKTFREWRLEMAGETNSNMTKIDEALYNASQTDPTLSESGKPADAKVVGENITDLKSAVNLNKIGFIEGYYLPCNTSPVDVAGATANELWKYAVLSVAPGDRFTLNLSGGTSPLAWCFIDDSGEIISHSDAQAVLTNTVITAPGESTKMILNGHVADAPSYYGEKLTVAIDKLESAIQNTGFYSNIMGRGSVSTTGRTFTVDKNKVEISGSSTSTTYRCVNLFGEPAAIESTFADADLSGQTFYDLNFNTDLYDLYLYIKIEEPRSSGAYNYIYAATKDNVSGTTPKYTLKNDVSSASNDATYIFNLSKQCPRIITSGNIALFAENRKANVGNTFWYWFDLAPKNHEPLTYEIKIPRSLFVLGSGYSTSGIEQSWEYSARTVTDIHIEAPCIITSANTNVILFLKSTADYTNLYTSALRSVSVDSLDARIELHTADSSAFRAEYIDDITIYTTKEGYEYFEETYTIHVKSTIKFVDLGVSYNKYAIGTGEDNLGLLIRNNSNKRVIAKPIVCDRNATIVAGQYGTVTINIIVGNQLAVTLHNGDTYTVPANTPFSVGFATSATATDQMVNVNYIVIPESYPEKTSYQKLTDSTSRRADAAFITDDNKIFMIGYGSGGSYTVKQGNTFIKARTTFDHDPGHANSCNYNNGKVYVSDWTDPTLIHVYVVDTDENTLTYEKDIVLPHPEDRESIEYYVTDNEKQIFFMGWNVGRETMCYGLYVQTASGYALAWERKSLRIALLQGFTMQDHYMYLVENNGDGNYNFLGLVRLDLATGIMQKSQTAPDGSSSSMEIEAAIPIGKETFMLVGVDGTTYMHTFVAEEAAV